MMYCEPGPSGPSQPEEVNTVSKQVREGGCQCGEIRYSITGEPRIYATQAESGTDKKCMFCGECGSRILNQLSTLPDTYNVKPGTLDDTSWFTPVAHTWVSKKQPWTHIPEGLTTFEENPK